MACEFERGNSFRGAYHVDEEELVKIKVVKVESMKLTHWCCQADCSG